jgi:hypothetical protein
VGEKQFLFVKNVLYKSCKNVQDGIVVGLCESGPDLLFFYLRAAAVCACAFQIIGIQYNSARRLHQSMELY